MGDRALDPNGGVSRSGSGSQPAQTEMVAVILLTGVVIISASVITISGASLLNDLREGTAQEETTNRVEEIDSRLGSVASRSGDASTEFSIGETDPNRYEIVQSGRINITPNGNTSCRASITLTAIRYEAEDGDTFNYEAGAVWKQPQGQNATSMHTPPDLTFDKGSLSLSVVNLTGNITDTSNLVTKNSTLSEARSTEISGTLFQGTCIRPDNVTISVRSEFYQGWSRYLDEEVDPTNLTVHDNNQTVEIFLGQEKLPEETDDYENDVVDLTDSNFTDVNITNTSIKVDKDANNTYKTVITPLTAGSTQVGEIRTVEGEKINRAPIDVVFVLDNSGSMSGSKMKNAEDAAQDFIGLMNSSYDRAGGVRFNDTGGFLVCANPCNPDREVYLTSNFDAANNSIERIDADDGTHSYQGLQKGNAILNLKSNSSRTRVMILLSDGKDDDDAKNPLVQAKIADKHGITIHSIGVGGNADMDSLEEVADTTGGTTRHVGSSNDLSEVFKEIFAEISESRHILRDPLTMQVSNGQTTFYPQIDGNTSHVANTSNGTLNLNDPLAPSEFSYSIDISDGQNVTMTSYDYGCNSWELTDFVHTNESTGNQYAEVRCTDINESDVRQIDASNTSIYLHQDNVSSLLDDPAGWWEEDLQNETLEPYLADDNETLVTDSNEAIVVFKYPDGDNQTDRMFVHYRIGESREEFVPKYVFNIEVHHLKIGRD